MLNRSQKWRVGPFPKSGVFSQPVDQASLSEEISGVNPKLILKEISTVILAEVLHFGENLTDLANALKRHKVESRNVILSEIQRQYQAIPRVWKGILADDKEMKFLMKEFMPAFASGNRQEIISAQKFKVARVFLRALYYIPEKEELLELVDTLRFRYVTSRR